MTKDVDVLECLAGTGRCAKFVLMGGGGALFLDRRFSGISGR
jgi:hypothetical protein